MEKIRVGLIGQGFRGREIAKLVATLEGVEITAICDHYPLSVEQSLEVLAEKDCHPKTFSDHHSFFASGLFDAVLILTAWDHHVDLAMEAMELGIPVGMEVGGVYDVQQCWDLVDTWERTKTPFMFMENCCYGRYELMVLNMVRQGLFGQIVHCDGSYGHDLRSEIVMGKKEWHYRYANYKTRNCENYPTHEIGPISKILNINKGNRFLTLNSIASKSAGMHDYIEKYHSDDEQLMRDHFNQGDVINTIIKCANGETINLKLDTTLPRFYSRSFNIHGTMAMYNEDTQSLIMDGKFKEDWSHLDNHWRSAEAALELYEHPIWKQFLEDGVTGGHGGMDGLVYTAFFHCLRNGHPMPLDVYDAAAWMVITPLSAQSVANNGAPVAFPDFTRGRWIYNTPVENPSFYHLD